MSEMKFYGRSTYLTPKECETIYLLIEESDSPLKENIKNKMAGYYQNDETHDRAIRLHKKRNAEWKRSWKDV